MAICDALIADKRVVAGGDGLMLSGKGREWLGSLRLAPPADSKRPVVRPCLDWTERRPHLAGWLGAAICTTLEGEARCTGEETDSRVLTVDRRRGACSAAFRAGVEPRLRRAVDRPFTDGTD